MSIISTFNNNLVDNHNLDDLLNIRVLENRSKSVSPEFICEYDDDFYNLYLYDLIAYIFLNSKSVGKLIDEEVIALMAYCECKMLSDEFIILEKDRYISLMETLRNGNISSSLRDMLRSLYIYNAAYMENEYLINMGSVDTSLLEEKNRLLMEAKDNIKKMIVPEQLRIKMNQYIVTLNASKKRNVRTKVKVIKKGGKKTTSVFNVRKNWGKKQTYGIKYLVDSGKITIVDKHSKKEESGLKKVRKKTTQ